MIKNRFNNKPKKKIYSFTLSKEAYERLHKLAFKKEISASFWLQTKINDEWEKHLTQIN